jgi:AraC-like DNA-binding protein
MQGGETQAASAESLSRVIRVNAAGLEEGSEQIASIARVRYVQLQRGVASMQGAIALLGHVAIGCFGGDRDRIVRADTRPEMLTLFVPTRGSGRLGTTTVQPGCAVLAHRATQLVAFIDQHFLPITICLSRFKCQEIAQDLRLSMRPSHSEVSVLRIPVSGVRALDHFVQRLFESEAREPGLFSSATRIAAIEEGLLRWCVTLLLWSEYAEIHSVESPASRRRAALRAREFIDAHLDQPLSLSRVCRASYASARALEYGFREMFGLSPIAYVRCARLSRVRHDLYFAERRPKAVTQLAMRWGFWHLSQFSKDYRALFGESPSATLARSSMAHLLDVRERWSGVRKIDICSQHLRLP